MREDSGTPTPDEREEQPKARDSYVPPKAEDIDTGPAETAPGPGQSIHPGVEESSRWH